MYNRFVDGLKYIDPVVGFVGSLGFTGIITDPLPLASTRASNISFLLPLIPPPITNNESVLFSVLCLPIAV